MSSAVDDAERLRVIAERASNGLPLGEEGGWLARRLRRYLADAPKGLTLDQAFGFAVPPGREPWWRLEARRERDEALREMALRFFPGQRPAEQARGCADIVRRYELSAWRWDRHAANVPPSIADRPQGWAWRVLKAGSMPSSVRQLSEIIAENTG